MSALFMFTTYPQENLLHPKTPKSRDFSSKQNLLGFLKTLADIEIEQRKKQKEINNSLGQKAPINK